MDTLPDLVLYEVFLLLRPIDRLRCSLVCRRWADVLTSRRLLDAVQLFFDDPLQLLSAQDVLANTRRRYPRLMITNVELRWFHRSFWSNIGGNLKELSFCGCDISQFVLCKILESCSQLQSLSLEAFLFSGAFFCKLAEPPIGVDADAVKRTLARIERLSFVGRKIPTHGLFRTVLRLMPNVVALSLRGLYYANFTLPSFFTKAMDRLVELDLQSPCGGPEGMARLIYSSRNSLQRVNLSNCRVNQAVAESLALCTDVADLDLKDTDVEDHHLEVILSVTRKLEQLSVRDCQLIGDRGCQAIGRLQHIRALSLDHCSASSIGLCHLQSLKGLQCLDLSKTQCNLESIHALKTLTKLTELKLGRCDAICDECVTTICDNFIKIERLDLSFCSGLTDAGCSHLHKLHRLRTLGLERVHRLSDRAFEKGVGAIALTGLNLSGNQGITDASLVSIATYRQALQVLNLSECKNITDAGITALVERLHDLRDLNIQDCEQLTDRSLEAIMKYSVPLGKFSVVHCNFSKEALERFSSQK